jgi:hypothetical protein
MLKPTVDLLYQPSKANILFNKLIKYIRVGYMLHIACLLNLILFFIGIENAFNEVIFSYGIRFYAWLYVSSFGITVFIISMIDAYGRYQNYKQIKDLFFNYGFDTRLIQPFMFSRCQRNAVIEAAISLGYKDKTLEYFSTLGYKWYHIFPDAFVKNPLVIFKILFWKKILVTKYYKLQNFYW